MTFKKKLVIIVITALCLAGCGSKAKVTEVVDISVDEPIAEPVIEKQPKQSADTVFAKKNTVVYQNVTELFEKGTVANVYNRQDYRTDLVKTIDGNYSQFKINNEKDALRSFEQIKELVGMKDPAEELVFSRSMDGPDDDTVYDFEQYYKGLPVFGGSVRVIVGSDGYPNWFTGNFVPDIELETTEPAISEREMYKLIKKMDVKKVHDDMQLCIIDAGNYKPTLAYSVTVDAMTGVWNDPDRKILLDFLYIVNADTGELISKNQLTIVD